MSRKKPKKPEPAPTSQPEPIAVTLPNYHWRGLASAIHFYARKMIDSLQDADRNTLDKMVNRIGEECAIGKRSDNLLVTYKLNPGTLRHVLNASLSFKTYDCHMKLSEYVAELSRRNSAHNRAMEPASDDDKPDPREVYQTALQAEAEGLRTPVESEQGDLNLEESRA